MSHRIERVNELIKEELGKIILKEIDIAPNILLTIIDVGTNADLSQTKVIISVFPIDRSEKIMHRLKKGESYLQGLLKKRLKMRLLPKINFELLSDKPYS